jgi:hypothetical protein
MRRAFMTVEALVAALCLFTGGCSKLDPGPVAPTGRDQGRWSLPPQIDTPHDRIYPDTEITLGPSGVACSSVRFRWTGWDLDGDVVGYGYSLHAQGQSEPLYAEENVQATTVTFHALSGQHTFRVWAIDDDGRRDPSPAVRTFSSIVELNAPRLTVRSNLLASRTFRGMVPNEEDTERVDVFTNLPIVFDWSCTSTCDVLAGYDVAVDDTTELGDSYDPDLTHLELDVVPGLQTLYIQAADSLGYTTRGQVVLYGYELTPDEYVVVVDDCDLKEHLEAWGTDDDRDAFYDTLTAACALPVVEYDMEIFIEEGQTVPPAVSVYRGASTVIWYTDGETVGDVSTACGLWKEFNRPGADYRALQAYVQAGGNLVLAGFSVAGAVTGTQSYTWSAGAIHTSPADTARGLVFMRDVLGVAGVVESGVACNPSDPWSYGYCFYGALPEPGAPLSLEPVFIDSVGPGGFPDPGKWPVYTLAFDQYRRGGLPMVERFEPTGEAQAICRMVSFRNETFVDEPCGLFTPSDGARGNVCYLGFPLYYLKTPEATAMMEAVLGAFGEL